MAAGQKSGLDISELSLLTDAPRIREQLERLLVHPLFANSKRYPALLGYTVEQTLLGHAADLKERSIGVEVFGRSPSYDANADPVVRITAGEVRKRLTQYYYDPAHRGELVMELPTGSYVPLFREAEQFYEPPLHETALDTLAAESAPAIPQPAAPLRLWRLRWFISAGVALLVVLAGAAGLLSGLRYRTDPPPPSNIERFWEPVTGSVNPTTFCLGEPAKNIDVGSINSFDTPVNNSKPEPLYFRLHYSGNLALADVITLTRTVAALASRHKAFRVVPASDATFAQLREGPFVLIGAFDNIWTLRVTQKLRFGFESEDGVALLVDRNSPKKTTWATAWDLPYQKLSRDYAIVARIHDQTTGQPVIIAAGISEEGTEAAGEILYNPEYLDSLLAKAPRDWEEKNMEAVIETQVIEGHAGPPNILAVETW
ncbi:MAG TPA: hypothetical protein VG225_12685 [Terracidiphilus sp.]|jgi:hypothetical protein|nr:hypothetical protein [Terracidiphilus sp.]